MNYREIAFQRFKEGEEPYCEECGITSSESIAKYNQSLHVHHLDCLSRSDTEYHKNNDPENLKVLCKGCHNVHHWLGRKHSTESRAKMSISQVGNKHWVGKTHSEETKKKMSDSQIGELNSFYGRTHSEETKRKISVASRGRLRSKETREKISLIKKQQCSSEEYKRKLADRMKGNKIWLGRSHTEETKTKISESNKGKVVSQEVRDKISKSLRENYTPHSRESIQKWRDKVQGMNFTLTYTNYKVNVICKKTDKPDGFYLIKNLKLSKEEKERIKSLPYVDLESL